MTRRFTVELQVHLFAKDEEHARQLVQMIMDGVQISADSEMEYETGDVRDCDDEASS